LERSTNRDEEGLQSQELLEVGALMGWIDPDTVPIPELIEGSFVWDGDVLDFARPVVDVDVT
jgi:hypothetical protein